jgi:hypothetical protein
MLGLIRLLIGTRLSFGGEDPVIGQPWYHEVMTWSAAKDAGWAIGAGDTDDSTAAAALAWHADYLDSYVYNPLWWAGGGFPRFKAALLHHDDLVNLHFDDLTAVHQVLLMWRRYQAGTLAGLLWAAERGDVGAARNIVGVGLHAMQDFYSHSNWVDDPARRDRTWHQLAPASGAALDPRAALHLYTGAYETPLQAGFKHHGKYAFDCTVLRRLPASLMDAICSGISPLSNTLLCRRWHECKGAPAPAPATIAGQGVPADVLYVLPPGIALDNTWLAEIGIEQRDIPDRGQIDAATLFEHAKSLATRHSREWLGQLDVLMKRAGEETFWRRVKTDQRTGQRVVSGPPELASLIGTYEGDLVQFEDTWRVPFAFLSSGRTPPHPSGADEGWFLRLEISTANESLAGTDADITAVVDGRSFLLDRMHERSASGGLGENRLLEHNDFEMGSRDTYVIGPLVSRPQRLVLRNTAATVQNIVNAAWNDLVQVARAAVNAVQDVLLSLVAGHADLVGHDRATWSWESLVRVSQAAPSAFTLRIRGGDEGEYDIGGTIAATSTAAGLRVTVRLLTLYCRKESIADRGTWEDEPFVVALVTSPAAATTIPLRSEPFPNVHTGHSRNLSLSQSVDVPRYGGLIVAAQVWESDDEGPAERNRIRDDFARGYDARTINQRSQFLDALGRAIAPDWKVGSVDAYAFNRGPVVEVAHLVKDRTLNQWVAAGSSIDVPFGAVATRTVSMAAEPPLTPPIAISPADGQRYARFPRTTTLSWQGVPGATSYRVEIDYSWPSAGQPAWSPQVRDQTEATAYTFDFVGSQPGRWRITALDSTGARAESPPSAWRGFDYTPTTPLTTPLPTAPTDGERYAHYPRTTTLAWQAAPEATGYQVEVDYGNRVGDQLVWTPWLNQTVTATSWELEFVGDQPGRWRVTAVDFTGGRTPSAPTDWWHFDYTPVPRLATPVLREPPDGQVYGHVPRSTTLEWAGVDMATGYRVEVEYGERSRSGNQWTPLFTKEPRETRLEFEFPGDQPGRWRVSAISSTGEASPSEPSGWRTFLYGPVALLSTPITGDPADGEVFSHFPRTTTLSWKPVDGSTSYHVDVEYGWSAGAQMTWEPLLTVDLAVPSLTFDFVGAQPGRWRVSARDETGAHRDSPPSDWQGFSYST